MTDFIVSCAFLLLALVFVLMRKAYFAYPEHELKRRAASGDGFAHAVYPVVAYGPALRALLWLLMGISGATALVLLDQFAPLWIDAALIVLWLWLAFSWIPNSRPSEFSMHLALAAAPLFNWLLNWSYPLFKQFGKLQRLYEAPHTGIYEGEDLRALLQRQARQSDNRISATQLGRLGKLVEFEQAKVGDYFRPWKESLKLTLDEQVSPKLLDEMHRSQQSAFAVVKKSGSKDIVGLLTKDSVGLKSQGKVSDYLHENAEFIDEDGSIEDALKLFAFGGQPMLIVRDKDGEVSGTLGLKEALGALLAPDASIVRGKEDKEPVPAKEESELEEAAEKA